MTSGSWLHGDVARPEPIGTRTMTATVGVEVDVVDGIVRTPGVVESPTLSSVGA